MRRRKVCLTYESSRDGSVLISAGYDESQLRRESDSGFYSRNYIQTEESPRQVLEGIEELIFTKTRKRPGFRDGCPDTKSDKNYPRFVQYGPTVRWEDFREDTRANDQRHRLLFSVFQKYLFCVSQTTVHPKKLSMKKAKKPK